MAYMRSTPRCVDLGCQVRQFFKDALPLRLEAGGWGVGDGQDMYRERVVEGFRVHG